MEVTRERAKVFVTADIPLSKRYIKVGFAGCSVLDR